MRESKSTSAEDFIDINVITYYTKKIERVEQQNMISIFIIFLYLSTLSFHKKKIGKNRISLYMKKYIEDYNIYIID